VTAFLVDGEFPARNETECPGVVADEYVPIAYTHISEYTDVLEALSAVDAEIYFLPEYYNWDLEMPTAVGCPFGGSLSFEPTNAGDRLTLEACAFFDGFVMTGTGTTDYDSGRFTLGVEITSAAVGALRYVSEGDGSIRVTGEYAGEAIDLSD
jgi:hypothetical protein